MRSVNGKYGEVWYYGKDEYVGRSLHNYGEFSPDECDKILSLANQLGPANTVCLDIGANVGFITQMLVYHGFETIAFEPQPAIFALLQKNTKFKAHCHNLALGSVAGTAKMPRVDYSRKGNFGGLGIGERTALGTIDVRMVTLDSMEFQRIGLIKLDVEGYELEVLKGGRETILRDKPIMYIEDDRMQNSSSLRGYIEEMGYTIEEHDPTLYREDNFFELKKNIWNKNYVSKNIICMPC